MSDNIMTFTDENGEKIKYAVLEHKLINKTEYIAMAPVDQKENIEIYKVQFDKDWNESLEHVEGEKELAMVRQVSSLKF